MILREMVATTRQIPEYTDRTDEGGALVFLFSREVIAEIISVVHRIIIPQNDSHGMSKEK